MFMAAHRNLIKKKFEGRFGALDEFYGAKIKVLKNDILMF